MIKIIIGLIVLVAIFTLIPYVFYRMVFYHKPSKQISAYKVPNNPQYQKDKEKMLALIETLDGLPYESVYIKAEDGVTLFGRYYHQADGAPLHIQMHGYKGHGIRDFCGGNKIARENGQNTLIVDQRAHGKSTGRTITFGVKEQVDCISWIRYANERFGHDTKIILSGVSMGAATVLLAAARADLPRNVVGVIADCPYNSAERIISKVCEDRGYPSHGAFRIIRIGGKMFGKFDVCEANVINVASRIRIPVLLIHGEDDRFVPVEMSCAMHRANPGYIQLETFPNAAHGVSYIEDTDRYTQISETFIQRQIT